MPPSMPAQSALDVMAAVAYFKRGDGFRGRWMPCSQPIRIGTAILVAKSEIVMMQTVQHLFRLPVLTLQKPDEPLNPRGREPRAWAMKITTAILMGNYAQLLKTDNEERDAARRVDRGKGTK